MWQVFFISLIAAAAAAALDSLPWQNEENCGQRSNHSLSNRPKRVVGGSDALEQEVPWQVELQRFGDFICGGAVVSRHAVVTAAHCAILDYTSINPRLIKVRNKFKKKMLMLFGNIISAIRLRKFWKGKT